MSARGENTGARWPRTYILSIYKQAVEHGFVWVRPISEPDAASLAQSLRNAKRRSTTTNIDLIAPEYRLVTVGVWEPGPAGTGQLPVLYDRLPDGQTLPPIVPGDGTPPLPPSRQLEPLPEPFDSAPGDLDLGGLDDFIASMVKNAESSDG